MGEQSGLSSTPSQNFYELKLGEPIEQEMKGGEIHIYQVRLDAGQFMHVVVDQRGIGIVVTLFSPDDRQIIEMNSPTDTFGQVPISTIADISGIYCIEMRALDEGACGGRYEVRIEKLRNPKPQDKLFINAQKLTADGEKLRQQGTAQSLCTAINKYEEALALWKILGDSYWEAVVLNILGLIYNSLGEPRRGLTYVNQALQLRRLLGDVHGEASSLCNIGVALWLMGELQETLNCFHQALKLNQVVEERIGEATDLLNIGSCYALLGEYKKGLDYLSQALRISQSVGGGVEEAHALTGIGKVYDAMGEWQKALDYLSQALQLWIDVRDRRGEAKTLHYTGVVYADLGEKQKALEYFSQALPLRRVVGDRRGEALTLHHIGKVQASLDKKQVALDYYHQALPLWQSVGDRIGEAETLHCIARVQRDLGNLIEARAQIETALDIVESVRTKLTSLDLRASFLATNRNYYEFYIELLMQLHRLHSSDGFAAAALRTSERARARSLLETLIEAGADIRRGVDSQLLERERALQQQINARAQCRAVFNDEQTAKDELDALLSEYLEVQMQIRATSPRYAALTQPQPLSVREIQQQVLDQDTLLLEYALGEERSFLWAVTLTSISSFELPSRSRIETAARHVYDLMTARNKRMKFESFEERQARIAQADAEYLEAAALLSQMVLGPAASLLEKKRLLIVSEGALQYVPFAALPKPAINGWRSLKNGKRNARGSSSTVRRPLVLEHEIVSLPSASALAVLRRELAGRLPAPQAVAVLADPVFDREDYRVEHSLDSRTTSAPPDPFSLSYTQAILPAGLERAIKETSMMDDQLSIPRLPFTRHEAEGIIIHVSEGHGLKALDFAASRATATNPNLDQYRIVHFATHGLLNSQHPELSGLVLSLVDEQGQSQDGFLRAHEIYNLNLSADLVVLSGCKTGLGKEVKGEGLIGLTRGFMYAGAARVVVSLWDVHDAATAGLMKKFYQGMLAEGRRPAAALQAAQVTMWREGRWAAPYYWAGFQLQGEWQ